MKVYILTLALSLVMAYFCQVNDGKIMQYKNNDNPYIRKKNVDRSLCGLCACLSSVPFFIITCFRYRVGKDYLYYVASFNRVKEGKTSYFGSNPVYHLIEKLASLFSGEAIAIIVATGSLLILLYWIIIYKLSVNPAYSIFLFWGTNTFYISLNGIRQGVAMAFLFVAFYFAVKRKMWPYLIFFLLGALTHKGVTVFLPVYWLVKIELQPKRAWLITIISVAVTSLGGRGLLAIVSRLGYGYYLTGLFSDAGFEWIISAINIVILCVFCFYDEAAKESEYKEIYQAYFWMQVLATASILTSFVVPLAKRVCWIFSIGQILSLPLFNRLEESTTGKLVINTGIILGFALSIYVGVVVQGAHAVLPYTFWWNR